MTNLEFGRTGFRRTLVNYPWFVDAKTAEIIVSEHDSHRLQFFNSFGEECRFNPFGRRGSGKNELINPGGVTSTNKPQREVIVADTGNRRICYYTVRRDHQGYGTLQQTHTFGHTVFSRPMGIEYDNKRNILVVADSGTRRVTFHDFESDILFGECRRGPETPLILPTDVAIDDYSRVYVSDPGANLISCFYPDGVPIFSFGQPELQKPWGLCFDRAYNLLVTSEGNNKVFMYNRQGNLVKTVASDVHTPKGVSVTKYGQLAVATGDPYNFMKVMNY